MPPRPLYRWKTFWLGLLVLLFLGSAWMRSYTSEDWLCYGYGGDSRIELGNHTGTVEFVAGKSEGVIGTQGFFTLTKSIDDLPEHFPYSLQIVREPGRFWLQITHWLLIVYFLIPSSAFLAWRAWRQRKHHRLTASTPA